MGRRLKRGLRYGWWRREAFSIMLGVLLITLAAGSILLLGVAKAEGVERKAATPVKILITGDSITQGTGAAPHTWRYFLAQEMTGPVDFVGDKNSPDTLLADKGETPYAVPFDGDHYAFAGGSICNQGQYPGQVTVGTQIVRHRPSIAVGVWGINDLRGSRTASEIIQCYHRWINSARAGDPNIDLVIARLPWDHLTGERVNNAKRAEFNSLLGWLARVTTTSASRVVLAQMNGTYDVADTYDGLHPRESGERKIAAMIAPSLAALGVPVNAAAILPGNVFPANPPPAAPRIFGIRSGKNVLLRIIPLDASATHITWCNGSPFTARTGDVWFAWPYSTSLICRTKATAYSSAYSWSSNTATVPGYGS